MTLDRVNREALLILGAALAGEPMPLWRSPPPAYREFHTSGPDDQVFIGLYVPANFLDMPLHDVSLKVAAPVIELARRIKAGGLKPSLRMLRLPEGTDAHWDVWRDVSLRTVLMDYPAPDRQIARDYGGRVVDWWNIDLECLERRCCVKALRFDVPLHKEKETNAYA